MSTLSGSPPAPMTSTAAAGSGPALSAEAATVIPASEMLVEEEEEALVEAEAGSEEEEEGEEAAGGSLPSSGEASGSTSRNPPLTQATEYSPAPPIPTTATVPLPLLSLLATHPDSP